MECLHAMYEMKISDLKKKLEISEEKAKSGQNHEIIRKLQNQIDAFRFSTLQTELEIHCAYIQSLIRKAKIIKLNEDCLYLFKF